MVWRSMWKEERPSPSGHHYLLFCLHHRALSLILISSFSIALSPCDLTHSPSVSHPHQQFIIKPTSLVCVLHQADWLDLLAI